MRRQGTLDALGLSKNRFIMMAQLKESMKFKLDKSMSNINNIPLYSFKNSKNEDVDIS
jgi:hypothetical protein